jgi:NMD protein affecting ribosome stability and mRNA decay
MMVKKQYGRKDRLLKEKRHDVYLEKSKIPEPTLCNVCGALFENGRWTWNTTEKKVNRITCPACRRIADRYPAGIIEIRGIFYNEHKDEILNLIHNIENQEKGEHPLERIIATKEANDHTIVTTTGIHLARRIGEALSRSYKGDYYFQYAEAEKSIRVYWER